MRMTVQVSQLGEFMREQAQKRKQHKKKPALIVFKRWDQAKKTWVYYALTNGNNYRQVTQNTDGTWRNTTGLTISFHPTEKENTIEVELISSDLLIS